MCQNTLLNHKAYTNQSYISTNPPTISEHFPNINPNNRPSITPIVTIVKVAKPIAAAVINIFTSINARLADIYAGGVCSEESEVEGVLGEFFFFGFCRLKAFMLLAHPSTLPVPIAS